MMSIERFFEIQFDDPYINREQLRKFMEDHLKRLAINNINNQYDSLITETQQLYELFFGALTDADTSNALQQSRTKSMENVRGQFSALVRRRQGLITNSFDEDSPEYQEFFPHGLTEYTEAKLENIETLMTRIITASAAHAAELGAGLSAEFSKTKDAFVAARGKQLEQKGVVGKASDAAGQSRDAVEIQLTKNLLTIALNNIGNAGAAAMFFDKSIIARSTDTKAGSTDNSAKPQEDPVK